MLNAGQRMAVIIGMWVAVGVALFSVGIYGAETGRDVGWLFVAIIFSMVFTTVVLSGAMPGFSFGAHRDGKVKRQADDKLSLLWDLMDDDERMAFKESLKRQMLDRGSDGELPYGLMEMLEEETQSYHAY